MIMWLKNRSLLYFAFFIAVLLLSAGKNDKECWNDFSKANKYFSSRSFMSMDVEYKLWEAHVNTTPDYTFKGNYYRSDKSYYQEYSGIESIFNDSIYLLVNRLEKSIYFKRTKEYANFSLDMTANGYQNFIKKSSDQILKETATHKIYLFKFNKKNIENIESVTVEINKKEFYIDKVLLTYKEPVAQIRQQKDNRTKKAKYYQISYSNIKTLKLTDANKAKISDYIFWSKGKVFLNNAYKDFKLVNL